MRGLSVGRLFSSWITAGRHTSALKSTQTCASTVSASTHSSPLLPPFTPQVCMRALPTLLDGNRQGKQQALQYGVLPLLVHLLRSSPSPVTLTAAAHTLAVLGRCWC